jgi:cbb3-type cytochrome oxidase subunit 3
MSLSDVMSNLKLSVFAEVPLVIFVVLFAGVCVRVFWLSSKSEMDTAARMPLSEFEPSEARDHASRRDVK